MDSQVIINNYTLKGKFIQWALPRMIL
jgi:hypothetical protein